MAYKAKTLCSGVFVSSRKPEAILAEDLAADNLSVLRYIDGRVNFSARTVSASFWGLINQKAVYHPGFGCTLDFAGYKADQLFPVHAGKSAIREHYKYRAEKQDETQDEVIISNHGDYDRLEAAIEWAFSEPDAEHLRRTRAVVVIHEGQIIAERYACGFNKDTPLIGWSMTKSVINALVGILVGQGKLSLDKPAPVPEWQTPGDERQRITLNHLLQMSSGLKFGEDYGNPLDDVTYMLLRVPDMAAYAASKKLEGELGTIWKYSSGTTNIISRIIRAIVGDNEYFDFPRRALFEPMGMDSAVDASGTYVCASFMYATARDWARFGQLYLQDGIWEERRILPKGWVRYTTTAAPQSMDKQYGAEDTARVPKQRSGRAVAGRCLSCCRP
ncbi:MAG: serine hydrolase [Pseudomonadota bacterium]